MFDALSGVAGGDYRIDGGDWVPLALQDPVTLSASLAGIPAGEHIVEVRAVDRAGNQSAIAVRSFRVTAIYSIDEACSLEQDRADTTPDRDDAETLRLLSEQGRDSAILCEDLKVDIGMPGT